MHDGGHVRCEGARDTDLARKASPNPPSLAIAVRPATGRCEGDHGERPTALGEFKRQCTPQRITDDVRGGHAEFVKVALERVGSTFERQRAVDWKWRAAVMASERRRDYFITSDKFAEHRTPVVPGTHKSVQEDERLAGAGTVQGSRDLSHDGRDSLPAPAT